MSTLCHIAFLKPLVSSFCWIKSVSVALESTTSVCTPTSHWLFWCHVALTLVIGSSKQSSICWFEKTLWKSIWQILNNLTSLIIQAEWNIKLYYACKFEWVAKKFFFVSSVYLPQWEQWHILCLVTYLHWINCFIFVSVTKVTSWPPGLRCFISKDGWGFSFFFNCSKSVCHREQKQDSNHREAFSYITNKIASQQLNINF